MDIEPRSADVTQAEQMANMLETNTHSRGHCPPVLSNWQVSMELS